jgi:predicted dehydrogenase
VITTHRTSTREGSAALRVGIAGCGLVATQVHLPVLARQRDVRLVGLAEVDLARRAAAARRLPGVRAHAAYDDLISQPDVDAVVVALPSALHAQAALDALRQGKHVYVEKPLATDLRAARCVVDAWRQTRLVGMVGFNYRFNPLYQSARRKLAAGAIGPPVAVRSVFSTTPTTAAHAWKASRATGGGVLLDLGSHHLDLIPFLLGARVCEVYARTRAGSAEADTAGVDLRLASGVVAQCLFSWSSVEEDRVEVYGQKGKLTIDRAASVEPRITGPTRRLGRVSDLAEALRFASRPGYLVRKLRSPLAEPSYAVALGRFVAAARTGTPAAPDLDDGYWSLAVVIAAEESVRRGESVPVQEMADAR